MKIAAVLGVLVGCASAQQPQPSGAAAARSHEAKAMQRDRADRLAYGNPPTYACGDTVLADQTTSGGERLDLSLPCFDVTDETGIHPRVAGDLPPPPQDRQLAANLAETELHSCHGIPAREREHSPFAHRRSIAEVAPRRDGVAITFKPVEGLTAAWLERAIQCHQARFAALGQPGGYLPDDPTLVTGARVTVTEIDHRLVVLVETPDADAAQLALQRARDLVAPAAAVK
jgi:hypothetical protein